MPSPISPGISWPGPRAGIPWYPVFGMHWDGWGPLSTSAMSWGERTMPFRDRRESALSEGARDLKLSTRLMGLLAGILAVASIAAFKGWLPQAFGPPFVSLFIACALTTA